MVLCGVAKFYGGSYFFSIPKVQIKYINIYLWRYEYECECE